ncbi:MAG TPA: thiamine phosphate synthase [Pasteurellaceae bacterium]|nr:thiamine phosphate synthase [Pasteurellaceae bacterium]
MNKIHNMLSLYFIAGTQDCLHLNNNPEINLLCVLRQALQAGITCFQFRDKGKGSLEHTPERQKALAIQCRDLCREYGVPFIVNDNVELCLAIDADGLHIGQSDCAIQNIPAELRQKRILGLSVNNLEQALENKDHEDIDYFGIGPIFPTRSKTDHLPALGLEFISLLRRHEVNKPCVAIGGITADIASRLRRLGVDGVAVISAITQAPDIQHAVRQLSR